MTAAPVEVRLDARLDEPNYGTFVSMPGIPMPYKMRVQRFHAGQIRS